MKIKLRLFQIYLLGTMLLQALNSEAQSVIKIAGNDSFSMFIKSDGSLWVKGFNDCGQYIKGTTSWILNPKQIVSSNVTAVAAGLCDSFFLKRDGSLWTISDGDYGTNRPVQIVPSGVTDISAGDNFTLFLKDDGSLWGFGLNSHGELGDGPAFGDDGLTEIVTNGVIAIAAGTAHSLFIKSNGSLWVMGYNAFGQLGDGTNINVSQPEQIVSANVIAVAAGRYDSFFIKSDGSLWAMGNDSFSQLGDCGYEWVYQPKQIVSSNVLAVAAGDGGTIFLKKDGSLWAMGWSQLSEYGEGISFESDCPVQIAAGNSAHSAPLVAGYYYNAALKSTASLWAKNFNNQNQPSGDITGSIVKSGLIDANPPGYNLISIQLLSDGNVRISYVGIAGTNYALDRSYTLTSPDWLPQVTNTAGVGGVLIFTNVPDQAHNNFWRIRSVQ
jgi:alpha-tubulin suppressor-like RCC1 family protein